MVVRLDTLLHPPTVQEYNSKTFKPTMYLSDNKTPLSSEGDHIANLRCRRVLVELLTLGLVDCHIKDPPHSAGLPMNCRVNLEDVPRRSRPPELHSGRRKVRSTTYAVIPSLCVYKSRSCLLKTGVLK